MDILLLNSSAYDLPSSRRVGAIAYDGTRDLRLWPGPGSDKNLAISYGPNLQQMLDAERDKTLGGKALDAGQVIRIHPGKLHCDMLLWVGLREPEPGTDRSSAPSIAEIEAGVYATLQFAASRNVVRIAFGAMGAGPGEVGVDERLAAVVRAARKYEDECFASSRPIVLEEVLVCEANSAAIAAAKRRVAGLAKAPAPAPATRLGGLAPSDGPPARLSKSPGRKAATKRAPAKPILDESDVLIQRTKATPYDRGRVYVMGEWMVHPKFGAGRVELVTQEGAIMVLFEDGEQRKMLHARP